VPQGTIRYFERERHGLEAVLSSGAFPPSSNSARLLSFLCESYFEDPARELTEYDIARGALGRRSDFDSRRDSVVRVEVHRLRKRLKEFYSAEGASLPVHISLPPGQYAPQFQFIAENSPRQPAPPQSASVRRRIWIWLSLSAAIVLIAAVWVAAGKKPHPAAPVPVTAPLALGAQSEVRLLAGFLSGGYVDQYGRTWTGDAYFKGGSATEVHYLRLARTADPALYQHARQGLEFSYDIPLKPGTYEMRLHFAEAAPRIPIVGESAESLRRFRVIANDKQVLPPPDGRHVPQFDLVSDSGGDELADIKVFKDVRPAADGKLHLKFLSDKLAAIVNAIEIMPGEPGKMHAIRLCADSRSIVDTRGNVWLPDNFAPAPILRHCFKASASDIFPTPFRLHRAGTLSRWALPRTITPFGITPRARVRVYLMST